jgi:phosphate transport system substrate-binding protein
MDMMKSRSAEKKAAVILLGILIISVVVWLPGGCPLYASDSETIRIGGTGGAIGSIRELALAYQKNHPGVSVRIIPHLGTRGGIKAVLDRAIDIGLAGRNLSPQELAQGLQEYDYGKSPFVFVTAGTGKMMDLTLDTIVRIYRGEIRKWPDGTPIRLILRPEGDIDTLMLKAISSEMRDAVSRAESREGMMMAMDDQENCDKIEKVKGAFGTSTLTQLIAEKRALTALPFNGVTPNIENMVSGRYPYYKLFHMVTGPRSSNLSKEFVKFVTSPEGKKILRQTGNHVPGVR